MLKKFMLAAAAAAILAITPAHSYAGGQGVYVKTIEGVKADVAAVSGKAQAALKEAGFTVLAAYNNGMPEGAKWKAETIVFTKPDYAAKVLAGGPDKAFALPLRLSVYEDEKGVAVDMMNPVSINRTVFQGSTMDDAAHKVVEEVAAAMKAVGPVSVKQAGQMRDTGAISGMGGGAFPDKVVHPATTAKSPAEAAESLAKGIADRSGWHVIYTYDASPDVAIVGLTNMKTEGRAFGIAGDKRSNSVNKHPGIDHAPAFPIEVVLSKKGSQTTASILKEMWRMKLYFEDAGNWAFMKNMAMPGQIEDEVAAAVKKVLK